MTTCAIIVVGKQEVTGAGRGRGRSSDLLKNGGKQLLHTTTAGITSTSRNNSGGFSQKRPSLEGMDHVAIWVALGGHSVLPYLSRSFSLPPALSFSHSDRFTLAIALLSILSPPPWLPPHTPHTHPCWSLLLLVIATSYPTFYCLHSPFLFRSCENPICPSVKLRPPVFLFFSDSLFFLS